MSVEQRPTAGGTIHPAGASHMQASTRPDAQVAAVAAYAQAYAAALLADGNVARAEADAVALDITEETLAAIRAMLDKAAAGS